ncbi:response regulator [Ensifer aridi]|uniref:response regulator n=1 Tax=Ensifer aridi TaxID=1708715 RepID=UPI0006151924|nr:response regulator [Ensifer aridi]
MRKLRVFLVEDEALVAMLIEDLLHDMGHDVGPVASRIEDALGTARNGHFDVAIIDLNLDGRSSYPIADILLERGVPFIFATGYGASGLDPRYSGTPVLVKPFAATELENILSMLQERI